MRGSYYLLILIIGFSACKAPVYLSTPKELTERTKGLILEYEVSKDSTLVAEIIEVKGNQMTLLPVSFEQSGLIVLERKDLVTADILIALTSNNPEAMNWWAGLLNLPLPTPIHLATTIPIMNASAKSTYRAKYPDNVPWEELYKFARFPQGIPEILDPKKIK